MKIFILLFTALLGILCLPIDDTGKDSKGDDDPENTIKSPLEQINEVNEGKRGLEEDGLFGDEDIEDGAHYHNRRRRVAWHDKKWPKVGEYVYIPYRLNTLYSSTRSVFQQAVAHFNNRTCVRWIPRTTERYYVNIIEGSGCYSYIGKRDDLSSSSQTLSLYYPGCTYVGIAMHEAMHAMGFYHTMSRRDRDNFIEFNYANIQFGREHNFRQHDLHEGSIFGESFDFNSVMMYRWNAFARDRSRPTIIDKSNRTRTWQTSSLWSQIDIEQINRLYQCNGYYTLEN